MEETLKRAQIKDGSEDPKIVSRSLISSHCLLHQKLHMSFYVFFPLLYNSKKLFSLNSLQASTLVASKHIKLNPIAQKYVATSHGTELVWCCGRWKAHWCCVFGTLMLRRDIMLWESPHKRYISHHWGLYDAGGRPCQVWSAKWSIDSGTREKQSKQNGFKLNKPTNQWGGVHRTFLRNPSINWGRGAPPTNP